MRQGFCFIPLTILFLFSHPGSCQESTKDKSIRYFNKTDAGVSFGLGSFKTDIVKGVQKKIRNDELVITVQTTNGIKLFNKLCVGLSLGIEKWRNGFFYPILAYLGYDLKAKDNTFFGGVYLGYGLGTRYATTYYHEGSGAFAFSIGLGYKMKVGKSIKFLYEIFYKYQALESSYNVYTALNDSTLSPPRLVDYKIPLHFAGFKIGVIIP